MNPYEDIPLPEAAVILVDKLKEEIDKIIMETLVPSEVKE